MDDAGLGSSVETEVWELFDADKSIAEQTVDLVAAALQGYTDLAEQLGSNAPAPVRPGTEELADAEPLHAFLRSITVEGFRGIGPRATLELNPYCGITVISGRNGSGKSSFAEALEYALTGQSYRWLKKKGQHWEASWRNLHNGQPASIAVEFAMEPDSGRSGATATVGVTWDQGAELGAARHWSQIRGQKREPLAAIGWDQALVTHRPLMSYDELGGLLEEGPSNLYDALNRLLGLDEIADADGRLKDAEKRLGGPRKAANDARTQLVRALDGSSDPRAAVVKKLVGRRPYDLGAVTAITLGTATDRAATIASLRSIAALGPADEARANQVADELRAAIDAEVDSAGPAIKMIIARTALLREALHLHSDLGEGPCPVCETGTIDAAWRVAAEERLTQAETDTVEHQAVTQRLTRARSAAEGFFKPLPTVSAVAGVELGSLGDYNDALARARVVPGSLSDLPAHVESAAAELAAACAELSAEAQTQATDMEDAWAPVARAIGAWVDLETAARDDDVRLEEVRTALKWLRDNAETLRARRLAPMVEQAREIWGRMRHESNVDLGGITLEGAANRRRAIVEGAVDGVPAGALSVMSQGELHALALALFIPRATTPASPFRFLVLDDPIQAMDPAKIGGFLDVLINLSKTRQIIVFSHDERLPAAIRARSVPAQLLDVIREAKSVVVVKENDLPADRYIADAEAIIFDKQLDDLVKRKAAPGLFRMAVESAAHQRFFGDRARSGATYHDSEAIWEATKTTQDRVALAVTGAAGNDLGGWKSYRAHRFPTMAICGSGAHTGSVLDGESLHDLRKTVRDIVDTR